MVVKVENLSPTQLKHIKMAHFYTYDGTWRTAEPSWRVMMVSRENVRGCPSAMNTMNDPAQLNYLQPGRRALPVEPPPVREVGDPASAAAAATAFRGLNFKDQKLSGFANETLCHTDRNGEDPGERWGRLGIMTRERLVSSDRFGDIARHLGQRVGTSATVANGPKVTKRLIRLCNPLKSHTRPLSHAWDIAEPASSFFFQIPQRHARQQALTSGKGETPPPPAHRPPA